MSKHIDALTGREFDTEEEYLAHVSPITGFTPAQIEHQGLTGIRVAREALKRTGSLKKKEKQELATAESSVRTRNVEARIKETKNIIEKRRLLKNNKKKNPDAVVPLTK